MGTLYVVATPIGNLKDITLRALEVLRDVHVIFAEDTRVTRKLLAHYDIHTPLRSYHEHSLPRVYEEVLNELKSGKNLALVTDAGTPAISDPGARLVFHTRNHMENISIIPIPGPSALTTALSVAGVFASQFTFLGYPPHKKGRVSFFSNLKKISIYPIILYESSHRLKRTLGQLCEVFGLDQDVIIARELTKIFEQITYGKLSDVTGIFEGKAGQGEFVIILSQNKK